MSDPILPQEQTVEERAAKLVASIVEVICDGASTAEGQPTPNTTARTVALVVADYHLVFKIAQQMTLVAVEHVLDMQESESMKMPLRGLDPGWRRPLKRLRETLRALRPVK